MNQVNLRSEDFFDCLSCVIDQALVDVVDLPLRVSTRHNCGDGFRYQTETHFTPPQSLLRTLRIFNIGQENVPPDNAALGISQREATDLEPPEYTVSPPNA